MDDAAKFISVAETELRRRGQLLDLHNVGFSGGTIAAYVGLGSAVMSRYRPVAVVMQLSSEDFGAETSDADHMNCFEKGVRRLPSPSTPSLGGSRQARTHSNLLLTMLLGGLWHGASCCGRCHGIYLTIERILHGEGKSGSHGLDHSASVAQGYVGLRVGERDLGLLPTAVARGHRHGLAEVPVPRQRRAHVVVRPRGALGARDGPGGSSPGAGSWRFPIVETSDPLLPAVQVLGAFVGFFFAALGGSPFIYFQF